MIFYGVSWFSFQLGVVATLLVVDILLLIATLVLKFKIRKMEKKVREGQL